MQRIIETPRPSVGLVVGTFAAAPYIHLQLESRRQNYPNLPLLVHDDGSALREELSAMCLRYDADFVASEHRHPHFVGDLAAFVAGFDWARQNNFDLLVKFSRRFIPLFDWVRELQELAFITQYATYSSRCVHYDFGFRTECIAMHVQSWFTSGAVDKIREQVLSNESAFVEKFIHDLAREVHKGNCEQNRQFEKFGDKPYSVAAYGDWMLSGISRHLPRPNVLWHDYADPEIYAEHARAYGLEYTAQVFADPNQGYGVGSPAQ